MKKNIYFPKKQGLYNPANEKDSCGVGFIARTDGVAKHKIVSDGLVILENLTHRGATGFDPLLGDGAGILTNMPHDFFKKSLKRQFKDFEKGNYIVAVTFIKASTEKQLKSFFNIVKTTAKNYGCDLNITRDVPIKTSGISKTALQSKPLIKQLFLRPKKSILQNIESIAFKIRASVEAQFENSNNNNYKNFDFYFASFSSKVINYKGMLLASQVKDFYPDLTDTLYRSTFALVHQRFSTNTFPSWELAQPLRMIAHNGEINTVRGNVNWMKARSTFINTLKKSNYVVPEIAEGISDSASFDEALDILTKNGISLSFAMMLMIPEAWEKDPLIDKKKKNFYQTFAPSMEPWDGPAAIAFTDGDEIGATLDRNGLRPARYLVTKDNYIVMASEMGVLKIKENNILYKSRLKPGQMLLVDLHGKGVIDDKVVKSNVIQNQSFNKDYIKNLSQIKGHVENPSKTNNLFLIQQIFGFTLEDHKFIIDPMTVNSQEPIGSMGNDVPPAVLSNKSKSLFNYFKQLFAQVTNPAIDPIREDCVMSLKSFLGPRPNLFQDNIFKSNRNVLELDSPVLDNSQFLRLKNISRLSNNKIKSVIVDTTFAFTKEINFQKILNNFKQQISTKIKNCDVLILSDEKVSNTRVPIPAALSASIAHQQLIKLGKRLDLGLVVASGFIREIHHLAVTTGYGADAVFPWLVNDLVGNSKFLNYKKALEKGLLKVMSKMGISTFRSYCGAQVFESIGLNDNFVNEFFPGTNTSISGIGLSQIHEENLSVFKKAVNFSSNNQKILDPGGEYAVRNGGEKHMWSSESISLLQHATRENSFEKYKEYAELINKQNKELMTFRGLFEIKPFKKSISIDKVEPWQNIVRRFSTGAMSLGSISTEAHSTLAIAMNRIGGKSNTGEGGEDPLRFKPINKNTSTSKLLGDVIIKSVDLKNGDSLKSKIKQVASGRFGVTAFYLRNAEQIQIKVAQGAKPGEGGQLPGHKVSQYIAKLRFSVPGVGLISPPPHHDIYSIEDLAQLIHDLKNVNPEALISVKLVSEIGVGTVAAGVSKAKSDHVTIAGYDGGTGASPISSIKHAGTPWELGLAETQQTLVLNKLRGRITVQVDGQMKTGRDVVIAAMLGADEFGFATAPLVVEGCIMMRKCHLNTCPVGIATQDPILRKKFTGQPEHVVNYFYFVAQEIREILASIGVKSLSEIIGLSNLLNKSKSIKHWKAKGLDFSKLFHRPDLGKNVNIYNKEKQDHALEKSLDNLLIKKCSKVIKKQIKKVKFDLKINNYNRSVGAMLSGHLSEKFGYKGLKNGSVVINFKGTAGQSFGAFLSKGISFNLIGEANDYVGKGLSGGIITIKPSKDFDGISHQNIIIGNTVLYGAVSGQAYFSGIAGERFAVRNSGSEVVVEGVGDHGCEYMTGGTVVILGSTGRNFAAGMSGGIAFIYDVNNEFKNKCNLSMVKLEKVGESNNLLHLDESDEDHLKRLLSNHYKFTSSVVSKSILDDWKNQLKNFVKVFPDEYRRVLIDRNKSKSLEAA